MATPTNLSFPTVAYNSIILNWTPGTGSTNTLIVRKQGSIPTSRTDGTTIYEDNGNAFIDTGLTDNTEYCYALYATDNTEYTEPLTGCSTTLQSINGECPTETNAYTIPTATCISGNPSSISGEGPWVWVCEGINGGANSTTCTVNKSIDGVCGTANRVYYFTATGFGGDTFCSVGDLAQEAPSFPAVNNSISWSCSGTSGGLNTNCTASRSSSSCISGGGLTCTESVDGNYIVNKYVLSGTTNGTVNWTAPVGVTSVEYLVIGGGGGGAGGLGGGGGGAGGFLTGTKAVSGGSSYTVSVGVGGNGTHSDDIKGGNGSNSSFQEIVSLGGGGGGDINGAGVNGGSGGGSGRDAGGLSGGVGSQGYSGGSTPGVVWASGSGGGGAGQSGGNGSVAGSGTDGAPGGKGGDGRYSSITGTSVIYAGGGGGASAGTTAAGAGGSGGGGTGGRETGGGAGTNGLGGGGGGGRSGAGGKGGSGMVIVRYMTSQSSNSEMINGSCGSAAKIFYATSTGYGTNTFCSSGTSSVISPTFPAIGQSISWSCNGINGGANANCTASRSSSSCISGGGLSCTETVDGNYTVNKYVLSGTTSGTINWTAPAGVTLVEYLIIGGGGGGAGGLGGGGGGAGGFLTGTKAVSGGSSYTVSVGAGGAGTHNDNLKGTSGSNSSFDNIIALGGGGGGDLNGAGVSGGSGGGSGRDAGGLPGGVGSQGYNGGSTPGSGWASGSGGGGAGQLGGNGSVSGSGPDAAPGGKGGDGRQSSITGTTIIYAGGGGGSSAGAIAAGAGGNGGGGSGGNETGGGAGTNGLGGGGGGGRNGAGGKGGSGIIVIRYAHP
ncbi:MAG: hypothetical protein BWY21_01189 [Parcubacteria group bacterium ADurb.Bin216]|nr:MAG: hypothetical protein BWY21_01189 [Parcubacteria group bacterium ADurb.Bin216]